MVTAYLDISSFGFYGHGLLHWELLLGLHLTNALDGARKFCTYYTHILLGLLRSCDYT